MKRKGLSQILYLIIAASVLMMIAMVITFTATDTIGSVGSDSNTQQCTNTIQGQCSALNRAYIDLPDSCVSGDQQNLLTSQATGTGWSAGAPSGSTWSAGNSASGYIVECP